MSCKARFGLAALVLTLVCIPRAGAFPPFPPFEWPWQQARDCPQSSYCCLHYATPWIYSFHAYHTPPRYMYPCAPDGSVSYRIEQYSCYTSFPVQQTTKYLEIGRDKAPQKPEKIQAEPTPVRSPNPPTSAQ